MQKLVFFDIDGTLVTANNHLPQSTKQAINELKENGHLPIISTGRPPKMFETIAKELEIESYISLNGQYIVLNGKPIFVNPIPTDALEELIAATYDINQRAFLLTEDDVIGNTFMREMISDSEFLTLVYTHLTDLPDAVAIELFQRMTEKPLKRVSYEQEEILSAFIHTDETRDAYYQERFPELHFTRATPHLSEVLMKGAHKGAGIERIVNELGLKMTDTVAFGDSLNDIEMIQTAGIGVAMGNGRQELKDVADFVTTHVEADGIYNGLKKLKLI